MELKKLIAFLLSVLAITCFGCNNAQQSSNDSNTLQKGISFEEEIAVFNNAELNFSSNHYYLFKDYFDNSPKYLNRQHYILDIQLERNNLENEYEYKYYKNNETNEEYLLSTGSINNPSANVTQKNDGEYRPGSFTPSLLFAFISFGNSTFLQRDYQQFYYENENSLYNKGISVYSGEEIIAIFYYKSNHTELTDEKVLSLLRAHLTAIGGKEGISEVQTINCNEECVKVRNSNTTFNWIEDFNKFIKDPSTGLQKTHLLFYHNIGLKNQENDSRISYYYNEETGEEYVATIGNYYEPYKVDNTSLNAINKRGLDYCLISFGTADITAPLT